MTKEKKSKVKKPFFKKWWFWIIIVLVIIGLIGGGGEKETKPIETDSIEVTTAPETVAEEPTTEPVVLSEKEQIEKVLNDRIIEKYTYTDIDSITINDNLGTDEEGDYVALVYLTWNVKNSGKTSKEMLKMYSADLAATLAEQNETVKELAIFWTVPYLNDNAKCSYERLPNGFTEMDMAWGSAFE